MRPTSAVAKTKSFAAALDQQELTAALHDAGTAVALGSSSVAVSCREAQEVMRRDDLLAAFL
jgi:hypothetical protein